MSKKPPAQLATKISDSLPGALSFSLQRSAGIVWKIVSNCRFWLKLPKKRVTMAMINIKQYQLQADWLWRQGHRWHSRALWLLVLNCEFGHLEATGQVERQKIYCRRGQHLKKRSKWLIMMPNSVTFYPLDFRLWMLPCLESLTLYLIPKKHTFTFNISFSKKKSIQTSLSHTPFFTLSPSNIIITPNPQPTTRDL